MSKKKSDPIIWFLGFTVVVCLALFAAANLTMKDPYVKHSEDVAEDKIRAQLYKKEREELKRAQRNLDTATTESERLIARRELERLLDKQEK